MFTLAYRLLTRLIHKLHLPRGKLAESLEARRAAVDRWLEWASNNRTARPLIWVHGASVGEALTAVPVIRRLRSAIPDVTIAHSFTSPSTVSWADKLPTDRSDYLPLDETDILAKVFDPITPTLIVCARGDLWPEFARTAFARGVPVAIISGTVRPSSRRRWPVARSVMRSVYKDVSWLGAASAGDAERWVQLGVPNESIAITGDTRHDHVLERVTDLKPIKPLLNWSRDRPTLVAGSTDDRDEAIILEAFSRITGTIPDSRLVIVPHDCSESRVADSLRAAARAGLNASVWTGGKPTEQARCIVVKVTGILADIYAAGDVAYVGGGFRSGGLHAVAEPAAFALPVIVGPEYEDVTDATLLMEAGGAFALPRAGEAEHLKAVCIDLLGDSPEGIAAGLRARRALRQGAADATASALVRLIEETQAGHGIRQ